MNETHRRRTARSAPLMMGTWLLMLAVPTSAVAQDSSVTEIVSGDPEIGTSEELSTPTKKNPLKLSFTMRTEGHTFENLDMLALDESSDQAIIDTDDRGTFAYSSITARADYMVLDDLDISVQMAHNGLWADDQLGSEAQLSGALNFYELSFTYTPLKVDEAAISFKIGRQPFKIGGVPTDYIFDDTLDAAVIMLDARKFGQLRILAADMYSANDLPDASFVRYVGGREQSLGFRGDTFTLRSGLIYEQEGDKALIKGLMVKAYFFYADMGGGSIDESGADISYGGSLGNFSDNDWVSIVGGRVGYKHEFDKNTFVKFYAEGAQSNGLDRKEEVVLDVKMEGIAWGGGVEAQFPVADVVTVSVSGDVYHFDGGEYAGDGLQFNHGFVGFKGRQVGGLNLNRYAGWHPSSYTGSRGIADNPQDIERGSGTEFSHAALGINILERATLKVHWWSLADTSTTFLDPNTIDSIDPPFGYSREDYEAEARLGKNLGQELNLELNYRFNKALTGYASYGVFMPGDFYDMRIDRVAGTALGGDTTEFWAATAGALVEF